jgi:GWxTD domain-containing protein
MGVPAFLLAVALQSGLGGVWAAPLLDLPAEATGEIHFQVDAVRLLSQEGQEEAHLFVGFFDDEVECREEADRPGRWISLTAQLDLLRPGTAPPLRQSLDLMVPCDPRNEPVVFAKRLVMLQVPIPAEVEAFELEIRDRRAHRRGLVPRLQSEHTRGRMRAYLPKTAIREGRGLAGPLFCWDAGSPLQMKSQGGYGICEAMEWRERIEANPSRSYGLFNPTVTLYAEAYGLGDHPLDLRLTVFVLADSTELVRETERVTLSSDHAGLLQRLDVSGLDAGAYGLSLEAIPQSVGGGESFRIEGHFQIHWEPDAWRKPQYQMHQEASLLLDDERLEAFLLLEPGQQEAHLDSLWAGDNGQGLDRKRLFQERVERADGRFTAAGVRGSLTDRGKTLIRFGEPEEVHKELMPQDADQLFYFLGREIDENESVEMAGRPLRHPLDNSPYQVWYYMNRGEPLFREWGMVGTGGGLRFVFVDELGDGNYKLVYTNLLGGVE